MSENVTPEKSRREQMIGKWLDAVFALYPFETTGFMRTREDQFANPVGHVTRRAAEMIHDAVLGADLDDNELRSALGDFIRVRAVQDFRPDQAVGAIYLFKPIMRDLLLVDALAAGNFQDYLEMESRIDTLALMAFAMYVADREKVYAERVAEQRRSTAQLKRWAERMGQSLPQSNPERQGESEV